GHRPQFGQGDAGRPGAAGGGTNRCCPTAHTHLGSAAVVCVRAARSGGVSPLPDSSRRRAGRDASGRPDRAGAHLRRRAHGDPDPAAWGGRRRRAHAGGRPVRAGSPRGYRVQCAERPRARTRRARQWRGCHRGSTGGGARVNRLDQAPRIAGTLAERDSEGRVRALRALLARPVLRAQRDGEVFRQARRHAESLREWFERETGWRLVVESQTVRLLTSQPADGATSIAVAERHPARARKGDPPFTRRRYVLLCLALAVLERSDLQVALGRLAEDIVLAARQPGLEQIDFQLRG